MSWNDFPKRVRRSILNHLTKNINNPKQSSKFMEGNDAKTIWVKLPFAGKTGEVLVNKCVKKLIRLLGKKVKFRIRYFVFFCLFFLIDIVAYITYRKKKD